MMNRPSSGLSNTRRIIVGHGSTFHDPAIAIIEGETIYAEAFERHTQCKRSVSNFGLWYSWEPIQEALAALQISPAEDADIDFRTSWNISPQYLPLLKAFLSASHLWSYGRPLGMSGAPSLMRAQAETEELVRVQTWWVLRGKKTKDLMAPTHGNYGGVGLNQTVRFARTAHHLAHAATAVYTSPFEECIVMNIDGSGETESVTFYHFANNEFRSLNTNSAWRVSLGHLYIRITEACGFDANEGEEWKVMGLAGYGRPRREIYDFFMSRTRIKGMEISVDLDMLNTMAWKTALEAITGPFRREDDPDVLKAADLAHNFQAYFTDVVCELAKNACKLGLSKNLALGGGCALNSSANGQILERSGFNRLHVPSAPADDGNALGVALYEKHYVQRQPRKPQIMSPYLGSYIDTRNLERILGFGGVVHQEFPDEASLCSEVAQILSQGKIIGWVQGRAEFGPRALGNRSILADPRPKSMKDEINRRVKFREEYRPLAPSILHEHGEQYFENYQESPYMERTLRFRESVRDKVPAVVHVDGTGRLQTVKEEWNPLFYRLISEFYKRTNIPILLNTSLNVMGKPIVHSVSDALTVLYTTDLDFLIVGKYLIGKRSDSLPTHGENGSSVAHR
jgi:carbamoyltransferase